MAKLLPIEKQEIEESSSNLTGCLLEEIPQFRDIIRKGSETITKCNYEGDCLFKRGEICLLQKPVSQSPYETLSIFPTYY